MTSQGDAPRVPPAKLAPPRLQAPSLRADQLEQFAVAARARLLLVRAPASL